MFLSLGLCGTPAQSKLHSEVIGPNPHRYQKSHRESKFPIFNKVLYLLGAPHFSGMILVENLGYSTSVLFLSLFPLKSYSPALRRVKHYHIQDFEVFFFRHRSF